MPNRRYESDRYNSQKNSTGSSGYGYRDNERFEGGRRGYSQWSRNANESDYDQNHDDFEGRSPRHDNYQFDRDPSSFDRNMSGRGSSERQGRGSAGYNPSTNYRSDRQGSSTGMGAYSDMGYNYQASTAQNQNRSSYWSPSHWDTSDGSEGRGINSYQSGYGSANTPGSYQGHGIDIGPGYQSDWNSSAGYGNAQTGYGSYEGTAGSQYGSYEGSSPRREGRSMGSQDYSHNTFGQTQNVNPGFQSHFSRSSQDYSARQTHSIPGAFAGRGPKGYRRSDERIKDDVCYALMMDPKVDACQIEVDVKDGAVTLTGTVEDRKTKRLAEDCLDSVQGVTDVHNQLKVQNSLFGAISNAFSGDKKTHESNTSSSSSTPGSDLSSRSSHVSGSSSSLSDSDYSQDSKSRQSKQKS